MHFWGSFGFWGGGIRFGRFLEKVMIVDGVEDGDDDGSEMACGFIYVVAGVICCSS